MMGYHDCPPHPFESLDSEYDAKWISAAEASVKALEAVLRTYKERQPCFGGVIPKRYK